jgi:hypothetical protein
MDDLLFIDFEWWKDSAGYRVIETQARKIPSAENLLSNIPKAARVVPNGGELVSYLPLARSREGLFRVFADIKSPNDVLRFIVNYGPLTEAGLQTDRGEEIPLVLEHAASFRSCFGETKETRKHLAKWIGNGRTFANLEASLRVDRTSVRLRIVPKNLLSGLWLQLAKNLAGGMERRFCRQCSKLFEAGKGTGRRLDAKFCSDEHRRLYNSLNRSRVDS